jgi:hypothetical protein
MLDGVWLEQLRVGRFFILLPIVITTGIPGSIADLCASMRSTVSVAEETHDVIYRAVAEMARVY